MFVLFVWTNKMFIDYPMYIYILFYSYKLFRLKFGNQSEITKKIAYSRMRIITKMMIERLRWVFSIQIVFIHFLPQFFDSKKTVRFVFFFFLSFVCISLLTHTAHYCFSLIILSPQIKFSDLFCIFILLRFWHNELLWFGMCAHTHVCVCVCLKVFEHILLLKSIFFLL